MLGDVDGDQDGNKLGDKDGFSVGDEDGANIMVGISDGSVLGNRIESAEGTLVGVTITTDDDG